MLALTPIKTTDLHPYCLTRLVPSNVGSLGLRGPNGHQSTTELSDNSYRFASTYSHSGSNTGSQFCHSCTFLGRDIPQVLSASSTTKSTQSGQPVDHSRPSLERVLKTVLWNRQGFTRNSYNSSNSAGDRPAVSGMMKNAATTNGVPSPTTGQSSLFFSKSYRALQ